MFIEELYLDSLYIFQLDLGVFSTEYIWLFNWFIINNSMSIIFWSELCNLSEVGNSIIRFKILQKIENVPFVNRYDIYVFCISWIIYQTLQTLSVN